MSDDTESLPAAPVTRRKFLEGSAAAGALTLLPGAKHGAATMAGLTRVRAGVAPPDRPIRLASIGVGAQGTRVMMDFLRFPEVEVVAVCDVNLESDVYSEWSPGEILAKQRRLLNDPTWGADWNGPTCGRRPAQKLVEAYYRRVRKLPAYGGCHAYNDLRELIAKEQDLDGVVVCTPDHWHANASVYALRHGKHVFCQKAMAHTIAEAGAMARAARETGLATQVAVMNEASKATRLLTEWVAAGVIGQVREVHNWSQRPSLQGGGTWPQGLDRPKGTPLVPAGLDWDLWLGPAPDRPYNPAYLPFVWRGWLDFGEGAIGDMGNYSFDTMFRVLELTAPTAVEASSTPRFKETFPAAEMVHWEFPARHGALGGERAPVVIHWYDDHLRPPRPVELAAGEAMNESDGEGMLYVGDKGKILCGFEGSHPRLIPDSRMKSFVPPPDTLPASPGAYQEWLHAIRGGPMPRANFEFEQPVVEALLLGCIAAQASDKLYWDSASKRITALASGSASALEAANAMINPPSRAPWQLA